MMNSVVLLFSSRTDRVTLLALLFKEGPCDSWALKHDTSCLALLGSTYWVEFLVGFDGWHMHQGFWGRGMGYLCCGGPPSSWACRSCFSTTSDRESFTTLRKDDKFCCDRATIVIWFKKTELELLSHSSQHHHGASIDTQLPVRILAEETTGQTRSNGGAYFKMCSWYRMSSWDFMSSLLGRLPHMPLPWLIRWTQSTYCHAFKVGSLSSFSQMCF